MRVFLDTEFTNLMAPRLLSVGLVADTETACELYVEIDLASEEGRRRSRASTEFVHETVLTQWGRVAGAEVSEYELGRRAGLWLLALTEQGPVEVVYDYKTDADLLEAALKVSGLLEALAPHVTWSIVSYLSGEPDFERAQEASWAHTYSVNRLDRHHALADARALRAGFVAVHGTDKADATR